MNQYFNALQNYWEGLNQRERWMGCVGSIIAIFYMIYIAIILPIHHIIQTQQQELQDKKDTWEWIEQIRLQYAPQTQHPLQKVDTSQLLSLLAKEFAKSSFQNFKYTMQQASTETIQIHFESVPYSLFMQWLYSFSHQYQIIIQDLQIEQIPTHPGLIKINIHLSNSNSNSNSNGVKVYK